ncbi:MAG: phenylalanyl-tRNA synthetase subunit alpha [uncultured bacterium (gcode 4)]|uniref:Phenylalanyl-tRNA synthetase subunit alpha n=1 Tax=uncultured bacterium (gcode 4) TaxID=1234023 RepID=K2FCG1_9BACT|nr:MAG: phenylalanyl-tRNA synthetase subunit alpha [uncultured bacterium (gcode 4)]
MQQKLITLKEESLKKILSLASEQEIIEYRNLITGKNWTLTEILKWIKDLSVEEKQTIGKLSNDIKNDILAAFDERLKTIKNAEIAAKLANEFFDVTEPPNDDKAIHKHPLTRTLDKVYDTFKRMWFAIYESAELTTEYLNFDSLNIPETHPARDMTDTFFLEWKGNVLATQTSSMQNIIYKSSTLPIRAIVPGRVFRNEDIDATHENTFYQVEWIVVDKDINLGHLKFTIKTMLSDIFWREVSIRLRPWFFPFVEPGVEIDFSCPFCAGNWEKCKVCKWSWWIEFMWAWLIHPTVLREWWIDPEIYSWFAFGFWLNRLVMIRYAINDIRYFQHPNLAFLKQF